VLIKTGNEALLNRASVEGCTCLFPAFQYKHVPVETGGCQGAHQLQVGKAGPGGEVLVNKTVGNATYLSCGACLNIGL
jgi:hypothetical protein